MQSFPGQKLFLMVLAVGLSAAAVADESRDWLERMNKALMTRNYDGVFSHWQGSHVETLRIIHRVVGGDVRERLVSLDGSGREFIRNGAELTCYLPDKRVVLIERRPNQDPLLGGLPKFEATDAGLYDTAALERVRLMGRETRMITVMPKDEFRYGYRLWVDEKTAMPLKTQLCDGRGRVIEQMVFANLVLPPTIEDSAFKPDVATRGFQILRNDSGQEMLTRPILWSALRLPPGFREAARKSQLMPGGRDPVAHLVFTDGLASVSVFVESSPAPGSPPGAPPPEISGAARMGSASTFSTVVEGHRVIAVGEVPPGTVQFIAKSMKPQQAGHFTAPSHR